MMKPRPLIVAQSLAVWFLTTTTTTVCADVTPLPQVGSTMDYAVAKPVHSGRSTMPPPNNQPCWRSTSEINEYELSLIQSPKGDLSSERIYVYCPDSGESNQYEGAEPPLTILAPNVHIKCGGDDSTESSCTLKGGSVAVYSPSSTQASSGFGLPYGYKIDTSNLKIIGMTFMEQETENGSVALPAVDLMAPGENMVFEKCTWVGLGTGSDSYTPPLSAVRVSYNPRDDDGTGSHSTSLLIRDSVMKSNVLDSAIIYTDSPTIGSQKPRLRVTIKDTLFEANKISSSEARDGMLDFSLDTETIIAGSCFVDNTVLAKEDVSVIYLHNGDNARLSNNFGENNDARSSSSGGCPEITNHPGLGRRSIFCDEFDATKCGNDVDCGPNTDESSELAPPTLLVDELMTPSPDFACWTSTKDIVTAEMGLIANKMTELLTHRRRNYVICPGTSISIGTYNDGEFGDESGEWDWPILVLAPNLRLLCGSDGSAQNNCNLKTKSQDLAIYSPTTDDVEGKIPASVLLGGDDYVSYKVDGSGLEVVGITIVTDDDPTNNGSGDTTDSAGSCSSPSFLSLSSTVSVLSLLVSSLMLV